MKIVLGIPRKLLSPALAIALLALGGGCASQTTQKSPETNTVDKRAYAHRIMGSAAVLDDDYDGAVEHFSKAIAVDARYVDAYRGRAGAYSQLGRNEEAIEDLTIAIEIQPDGIELYCDRGMNKALLNRDSSAVDDFTKAIELETDHAEAYRSRGIARVKLGLYNAARDDLAKSVELGDEVGAPVLEALGKLDSAP